MAAKNYGRALLLLGFVALFAGAIVASAAQSAGVGVASHPEVEVQDGVNEGEDVIVLSEPSQRSVSRAPLLPEFMWTTRFEVLLGIVGLVIGGLVLLLHDRRKLVKVEGPVGEPAGEFMSKRVRLMLEGGKRSAEAIIYRPTDQWRIELKRVHTFGELGHTEEQKHHLLKLIKAELSRIQAEHDGGRLSFGSVLLPEDEGKISSMVSITAEYSEHDAS